MSFLCYFQEHFPEKIRKLKVIQLSDKTYKFLNSFLEGIDFKFDASINGIEGNESLMGCLRSRYESRKYCNDSTIRAERNDAFHYVLHAGRLYRTWFAH